MPVISSIEHKKSEFNFLITGVIFVLVSVLLGAFGAHGLEKLVDSRAIASFNTGVRYQMYHGLALILLANIPQVVIEIRKKVSALFLVGTLLFSVSIYLLSLDGILPFSFKKIAWVTPIGGLLLIAGWIYLLIGIIKNRKTSLKEI